MLSRTSPQSEDKTFVENSLTSEATERLEKSLKICERQTIKVTELVDGLLDLSHIRAGMLELRPQLVNLYTVVKETVDRFQNESDKKGITLSISTAEAETKGYWDLMRIEQLVTNLISNAI